MNNHAELYIYFDDELLNTELQILFKTCFN
jgi:hypothetical protein